MPRRRRGQPRQPSALPRSPLHSLLFAGALSALVSAGAAADSVDQAKRIHDRIAGVPPDGTTLGDMASEISGGDPLAAAMIATDAPEFYSVTLKNFAAPWTNRDRSVFVPLNDYTATVIGMVRDEVDFRQLPMATFSTSAAVQVSPPTPTAATRTTRHWSSRARTCATCSSRPPSPASPACPPARPPA